MEALSSLADTVRANDREAAARVDRFVAELTRSAPSARSHAYLVRRAVEVVLDAYSSRFGADRVADERAAYISARRAMGRIREDVALQQQAVEVAGALRALTNLVAVVNHLPTPFLQSDMEVQIGYDAGAFRERAARASSAVLELARERDWDRAGTLAARAVDTLAGVVEVAPLSSSRERWRSFVVEMRYQALEIEREGVVSLERSDRLRAALLACTTALAELAPGPADGPTAKLAANASAATRAIDVDATFVFQRGIIQEAMRSVADTFLVASASAGRDSTSASR